MRHLIDTNVLIWAAQGSPKLSSRAAALLSDAANELMFSSLSVAEVAIKFARGRPDFLVDPIGFRQVLSRALFRELPVTGLHAARLIDLPPIHKDPFDRLMVAQALAEGVPFVTADRVLAGYPGQIVVV